MDRKSRFRTLVKIGDNYNKWEAVFGLICFIILVGKVAALLIFNLTRLKYVTEYDSSVALMQAIEIWRQKTLFLNGWAYQTTLSWDSSVLLAAPLYGLTKDIFLAYGFSNDCLILAFVFFLDRICNDLALKPAYKFFSISLIFTVFTKNQLGYAGCLFTSAAFYGWRVLAIIILLSIMVRLSTGKLLRQQWGSVILCVLLLFVSGASAGSYVLICGVLPLLLFEIWSCIAREQVTFGILKKPQTAVLILAALASLAGLAFSQWLYPVQLGTPDTKTLSSASDLLTNVGKSLVGILELLGGITAEHPTIFSEQGIQTLLGFAIVCALFISAWCVIKRAIYAQTKGQSATTQYGMMILWLFGVNAFCLSYANLTYGTPTFEYRYWTLPIVPMFLLIGLYLANLEQHNKTLSRFLFVGVIIVSTAFSVQTMKSYYQMNNNADSLQGMLAEIAAEKDIETLYVVNDDIVEGRIMRTLTSDFDVITIDSRLNVVGWGAKISGFDTTNIAVLAREDVVSANPVLRGTCTMLRAFEYGQYNLYACPPGVFDFHSGLPFPEENAGWDSPTAPGYCIASDLGAINETGELVSYGNTNAGYMLYGPYTESIAGIYNITLHYAIDACEEDITGTFDVALDAESWSAVPFDDNTTSVTLKNVEIDAGHTFEARVWVPEGMVVRVQSIECNRVT